MKTVAEILANRKVKNKAFTMIELLVVVAIIGILVAAIVVAFVSARQKSRDARRKTDLKNIQVALQLYSDDHEGKYPTGIYGSGPDNGLTSGGYMSNVPHDPNGSGYFYGISSDRKDYALGARLENGRDAVLKEDLDGIKYGVNLDDPVYGISD